MELSDPGESSTEEDYLPVQSGELYDPGESSTDEDHSAESHTAAESYMAELQKLTEDIKNHIDLYDEVYISCFRSGESNQYCIKYLNNTLFSLNQFELPNKIFFTNAQKKKIKETLLKLLNSREVMQHFLKMNEPIKLPSSLIRINGFKKDLKIIKGKLDEIKANIIAKLSYLGQKNMIYDEEGDPLDYYDKYNAYFENLPLPTDDPLPTGGRSRKYKKKTVRRKTIGRKTKTRKIIRRKTKTRKTKRY